MRSTLLCLILCALALSSPGDGAQAAPVRARKYDKPPSTEPAPSSAPAASTEPPDTRPYDPQLMRLAEVLGALTTLRRVCGSGDAEQWRGRMQALLDAEGTPASRKDRLAGAFNRGLHGYELSYRGCTANARLVMRRFLDESSRLARDIAARYRAS